MNQLIKEIIEFRDQRNWEQFHNPKDLAISLSIEASELLEVFQWKSPEVAVSEHTPELRHELADIMIYALTKCHDLRRDPKEFIQQKPVLQLPCFI